MEAPNWIDRLMLRYLAWAERAYYPRLPARIRPWVVELDRRWIESGYTRVVHAGGEDFIRTSLKELEGTLDPARFWQIHRSVIVNHREIASALRIDDANMVVQLRGREQRLPVSRQFQHLFKGQ